MHAYIQCKNDHLPSWKSKFLSMRNLALFKHAREITILFVYCGLILCTTPQLVSELLSIYILWPLLQLRILNSLYISYLSFLQNNNIILTGEPMHCIKKVMVLHPNYNYQLSSYPSLSAIFNQLHNSMNQELFKMYLCNQHSHFENADDFH